MMSFDWSVFIRIGTRRLLLLGRWGWSRICRGIFEISDQLLIIFYHENTEISKAGTYEAQIRLFVTPIPRWPFLIQQNVYKLVNSYFVVLKSRITMYIKTKKWTTEA